jgi:membrane protease YdiL (CAAX protease family)
MKKIVIWMGLLVLSWSGLWAVAKYSIHIDGFNERDTFIFWTSAKVVFWLIPSVYLLRLSRISIKSILNIKNFKTIVMYGSIVGLLIALTGVAPKIMHHQSTLSHDLNYAVLNVLVVAPLFEEFVCRGVLMRSLENHVSKYRANLISAMFFLALHIPGWYFSGVLYRKVTAPLGGALSILALGLIFGWVSQRTKSFLAGTIAHALNNLANLS